MLQYKTHADAKSLYNTPPCYGIYICGLVFEWLKAQGGLEAMRQRNVEKAQLLYDFLDQSALFKATARKEDRSIMNVPFVTGDAELNAKFVAEAKAAGIESIKGHRSVGGMRASIYNAMPREGVEALVAFMKKFEEQIRRRTKPVFHVKHGLFDYEASSRFVRLSSFSKERGMQDVQSSLLNNISAEGLAVFTDDYELVDDIAQPMPYSCAAPTCMRWNFPRM